MCSVASPDRSVTGSSRVEMSENPMNQVGSATAIASQSSSGSRSIAVSPPRGGTTARMDGSVSMLISSAARSAAGPLTCESPSRQAPSTTR